MEGTTSEKFVFFFFSLPLDPTKIYGTTTETKKANKKSCWRVGVVRKYFLIGEPNFVTMGFELCVLWQPTKKYESGASWNMCMTNQIEVPDGDFVF